MCDENRVKEFKNNLMRQGRIPYYNMAYAYAQTTSDPSHTWKEIEMCERRAPSTTCGEEPRARVSISDILLKFNNQPSKDEVDSVFMDLVAKGYLYLDIYDLLRVENFVSELTGQKYPFLKN